MKNTYDINIRVIIDANTTDMACNKIGMILNKNDVRFVIGLVSERIKPVTEYSLNKGRE